MWVLAGTSSDSSPSTSNRTSGSSINSSELSESDRYAVPGSGLLAGLYEVGVVVVGDLLLLGPGVGLAGAAAASVGLTILKIYNEKDGINYKS